MSNRLGKESSPYLRQHAGNPVDWWPWCPEALDAARKANVPILLSIGYSACHWCHVMAHESFDDPAIAGEMNRLFVNVKVDREERPDLDKVYQAAHVALTGRGGGWPLTVFLTPDDLVPFFAGTYFPPLPRGGMPGFVQVLEGVRAWYDTHPDDVRAQNGRLVEYLSRAQGTVPGDGELNPAPIERAIARIRRDFDHANGGHTGAPKFPHASELELLLGHDADTRDMALLTLSRMAGRGLADHLGGGFFRYSVDARWEIPHFEKMLYDNALLLPLYARAASLDGPEDGTVRAGAPAFDATTRACAAWLMHEMQAADGGFHSSLDADSEGEEGRFYLWQRDAVQTLLSTQEFAFASRRYGLDRPPNFEGRAWHLVLDASPAEAAAAAGIPANRADTVAESVRRALFDARAIRARPALDDKVLTSWNALVIAGAARAVIHLPDQPLLAEAEHALDFLHAEAWRDGRLHAVHAGGTTRIAAFLDDYAFLLDALLAMLPVRWKRRDLDWALALADALLERFEDRANGGFFFTADDAERLPQRPKPFIDESLPSGNGIAVRALLKLGHLTGDVRWLDAAERTLRAGWPLLAEHPEACCTMLLALEAFLNPAAHIVLRIDDGDEADRWNAATDAAHRHGATVFTIPANESDLHGALAEQGYRRGGVAWLCAGHACLPPITDPMALVEALANPHPAHAR